MLNKISVVFFSFFHVKQCPNTYCPYCRQAVWHLNHPPLTSLIWFPFLPYPLSHQHLLATVHSLLQYPVDLQRSVSSLTTDLNFYLISYFLGKHKKKNYIRFAWKVRYRFSKLHLIIPFNFNTLFPKSLMLLPSKQFEGVC